MQKQIFAPPPCFLSKNSPQCLERHTIKSLFLLLFHTLLLLSPLSGQAQENPCSTPDPDPVLYEALRNQVSLVHQFAQSRSESQITEIPVYYTITRSSSGVIPGISGISAADVDATLDFLNDKMNGTGLHFYRLGEINYLDHDIFDTQPVGFIYPQYSYVKTAMNVYGWANGSGFALQPGSNLLNSPAQHNATHVDRYDLKFMGSSYPHETGHNFGLMHTFGPVGDPNTGGPLLYRYPVQAGQVDHPQDGDVPRELAIRTYSPGKNFANPNCYESGDLFCDTDADCAGVYIRTFPKFETANIVTCIQGSLNCIGGCGTSNCAYSGTYRDYNEDLISGATTNFMSYGDGCRTMFSQEQKDWMAYTYQDYWSSRLADLPINVNDQVEVHGTSEPMKNVVIRWRHSTVADKYTNSLSQPNGNFQGILYDTDVTAEVRKIGKAKKTELYYPPNQSPQPYFVDDYTKDEWLEGLTTYDLVCIARHILNLAPLNDGYRIIAADANKSNSVTTFDIVEFRKLLLGIYDKLPAHNAPWRFVPEYVPQNHTAQFNLNPFGMTINGQFAFGTPYTEPTWEYTITNGNNGQSGYDGIKIGDVCDTQFRCEEPPVLSFNSTSILTPNEIYEIAVKATDNFDNIIGFQLGIFVDHQQLEVQDVENGVLPEFAKEDNVGMTKLAEDQLNMVWFQSSTATHTLTDNSVLFKLKVKALQPVSDLSSAISLQPEKALLGSEFFDENGCKEVQLLGDIGVWSRNDVSSGQNVNEKPAANSTLYCYPNPVGDQLNLVFENVAAGEGALQFSDVNGKLIKSIPLDVVKGINKISLQGERIEGLPAGVLNLFLHTDDGVKVGRLVKL